MKETKISNPHLADVYTKSSVAEKRSVYKEWATTYDNEVKTDFGYVGPHEAAKAFNRWVPDLTSRLLDAGCGTGLVGKQLFDLGYQDLHGADFSPEMLARARALGVYASLVEADLTKPLQTDGQLFDAAISVGLYGFGPPHLEHLSNVVNAVKPGGLTMVTVNGRGWRSNGWEQTLGEQLNRQDLELVDQFTIEYLIKENIEGKVLVLKRT